MINVNVIRGIAMILVRVDEAFMSMLSNSKPSVMNRCVMYAGR